MAMGALCKAGFYYLEPHPKKPGQLRVATRRQSPDDGLGVGFEVDHTARLPAVVSPSVQFAVEWYATTRRED